VHEACTPLCARFPILSLAQFSRSPTLLSCMCTGTQHDAVELSHVGSWGRAVARTTRAAGAGACASGARVRSRQFLLSISIQLRYITSLIWKKQIEK
jgi:hypothetical protein